MSREEVIGFDKIEIISMDLQQFQWIVGEKQDQCRQGIFGS